MVFHPAFDVIASTASGTNVTCVGLHQALNQQTF